MDSSLIVVFPTVVAAVLGMLYWDTRKVMLSAVALAKYAGEREKVAQQKVIDTAKLVTDLTTRPVQLMLTQDTIDQIGMKITEFLAQSLSPSPMSVNFIPQPDRPGDHV